MKRFLLTSMKRVFIFVLLISFGSIILNAQPISEDVARKKAASFFLDNKKGIKAIKGKEDHSALEDSLKLIEGDDAYYIFNLESKGGYVIVSGDDRMPAVLGYSMEGCFKEENMPDNLRAWLDGYKEQYKYLQTHEDAITVSETTTASESRTKIYPLLTTCWGQGAPYNEQCPEINGERTVTGCVATAMAQIMNYHQWPNQTSKTIEGYTTNTEKINVPAIDVTTIDWDNMMDLYNTFSVRDYNTPEKNKNAVSTLMKLCGASVEMDYTLDESGASVEMAKFAFAEYFDYDKSTIKHLKYENYSYEGWVQMIYNEIKNKRPVLYSCRPEEGDGHAVVIDGYDKDNYFHVNWGWDGACNGHYLLTALRYYFFDLNALVGIQGKGNTQHKYPYAEVKNQEITFFYDDNREQKQGEVLYDIHYGMYSYDGRSEITSASFDPSFSNYNKPYRSTHLFRYMENLKSISHLEYLNTLNIVDMSYMFYNCLNLTSLDLSKFNTSNVIDMYGMFYNCQNLTSLDVSNFNTSNVIDMYGMFYNCQNLTSLDVSNFNTSNVTNMYGMFYNCQNLTSLDVSNFNTSNVTNMYGMFNYCQNLTSLDVSSFNTSKVTDLTWMFASCKNLTSLDVSSFNTSKVTDLLGMFCGCQNLTSLDVSNFNTQNVTNMYGMFAWCQNLTSLDVSNFNTSNVTDMSNMFDYCKNLTSLDVSNFNTQNVTNMYGMFDWCQNLTSLDVSNFNTSNVTNMSYMFYNCKNLTSLDVSSFNTSKVTDLTWMFAYCSNLAVIYCKEGADWSGITNSVRMFYDCNSLSGQCEERITYFSSGKTNASLARICTANQDGYFTLKGFEVKTAKVLWDSTKKTLVFFYDGKAYEQGSTFVTDGISYTADWVKEWKRNDMNCAWGTIEEATTAVFDNGFKNFPPLSCSSLFSGYKSLEKIVNFNNLNTSNVTNMGSMFAWCQNLTSLDVSNFNTSNVTDMSRIFFYCQKLTSLDVSNFNTSNVTNMDGMFAWCQNLTSLDVSNFNTSKVEEMNFMFEGCNNLAVIYCKEGTDWSGVKNSFYMFSGCSKLKGYCEGRTTSFSSDKTTDATLARVCTSTQDGYFTDKNTSITEIRDIENVDLNESEIYNIQGVRTNTLHRGINIIRMSDGTTKKVMVK